MKIELDLPEIEGFEPDEGKQPRMAKKGDNYTGITGIVSKWQSSKDTEHAYIILKKKAPEYRTHEEKVWLDGRYHLTRYVEIKAIEDAIGVIDSHYNWGFDNREMIKQLKELIK